MDTPKNRIHILNCPVDALTMNETVDIIDKAISRKEPVRHVAVNAAKLVNMQKNRELMESVITSDIINADGQSVVWASRLLGQPLPERVAGIDLMDRLVELASRRAYKIYFLGAREEIVKKVCSRYSTLYSDKIIAGYRNGYFNADEESLISESIANSRADILFVGMPSPKKELFLDHYKDQLNIPFIMGVGGSFDVVAGLVKRAPKWIQKIGLEWFHRLIQEPRKMWKRYLFTNCLFIFFVMKEKLKGTNTKKTRS